MTTALGKPLMGSIHRWGKVRMDVTEPAGLGYRVAGDLDEAGGIGILTTEVLVHEGDAIETANVRYVLVGDEL